MKLLTRRRLKRAWRGCRSKRSCRGDETPGSSGTKLPPSAPDRWTTQKKVGERTNYPVHWKIFRILEMQYWWTLMLMMTTTAPNSSKILDRSDYCPLTRTLPTFLSYIFHSYLLFSNIIVLPSSMYTLLYIFNFLYL